MTDLLPAGIQPLFWGISVCLACSYFGDLIDKKIRDSIRVDFYHSMVNTFEDVSRLQFFADMFDRLFRPCNERRPRFWRSSLASLIVFCALSLVWILSNYESVISKYNPPVLFLSASLVFGLPINFLGDYLSLWQTRYIIGKMASTRSNFHKSMLFVADIVLTVTIYFVGLVTGTFFLWIITGFIFGIQNVDSTFAFVVDVTSHLVPDGILLSHSSAYMNLFGIFFITTLFTSIWLWVFLLGLAVWPLFAKFKEWFTVEQHPVWTVMTMGGMWLGLSVMLIGWFVR